MAATGGASLFVQGAVAGVGGGLVSRAIETGSVSQTFSPKAILVDAAIGGTSSVVLGRVGAVVAPKVVSGVKSVISRGAQPKALVPYDGKFAAQQLLGRNPVTPGGRTIMSHAAERMVKPPAGRAKMTIEEVDTVLNTANRVRKVSQHPQGDTVTVQSTTMPGKPQVVVDAATGKRVISVIKDD